MQQQHQNYKTPKLQNKTHNKLQKLPKQNNLKSTTQHTTRAIFIARHGSTELICGNVNVAYGSPGKAVEGYLSVLNIHKLASARMLVGLLCLLGPRQVPIGPMR